MEFSTSTIDKIVREKNHRIQEHLDALDIDKEDHKRLSDILDPDHSGTVGVLELVDGLKRLRGEPRRSDIVTVDLMVRALQEKVHEILDEVKAVKDLTRRAGKRHRKTSPPPVEEMKP